MQSLVENAFWYCPAAMLLVDPHKNAVRAANLEASQFIGLDLPKLRHKKVSELIDNALPELVVLSQEAIATGKAWSNVFYINRFNPEKKNRIELSVKTIHINSVDYLQFTFQDAEELQAQRNRAAANMHYRSGIAQWNRAAKVFQEFEQENRLILDAAGEGIYGVDGEGKTTFLNPAAEKLLGWKAEELIGKNIHETIHAKHADGSHYHVQDCYIYQAFREGIVNCVDDEIFWTKSGQPIQVEYTSTPIKDNGHVVGAVVIFRDVTEKRLAKQQLIDAIKEVENLKQRLEMENAYLQEEINSEFNHHHIVGKSVAIQHLLQKIELVAPADATVLISGESGTGKELIARAIHELSQRGKRSLIRVNCAAIPADLFESEFFGHSKGAFTGAISDRPGRFELADGGTLFLDEVGEIPLALQGKLLRVLQEQQFERIGESSTRHVDVRIITATNRNLKELVEKGQFREDLYFRLNVFPIESVPLRARLDDIPLLAQHFLERASRRANKSGLKISLGQIEKLKHYRWPGNIRELENVIERQVILAQGDNVKFDDFNMGRDWVTTQSSKNDPTSMGQTSNIHMTAHQTTQTTMLTNEEIKLQEKRNIMLALQKCHGKVFGKNGAAELLGIRPTTLASKLKRQGIDITLFKNSAVTSEAV